MLVLTHRDCFKGDLSELSEYIEILKHGGNSEALKAAGKVTPATRETRGYDWIGPVAVVDKGVDAEWVRSVIATAALCSTPRQYEITGGEFVNKFPIKRRTAFADEEAIIEQFKLKFE